LADPELIPLAAGNPFDYTVRATAPFQGGGGRAGIFAYTCYLFPAGAAGLPVFTGALFSPETAL
jgi:hypothetical protein